MDLPGKEGLWGGGIGAAVAAILMQLFGRLFDKADAVAVGKTTAELTYLQSMVGRIGALEAALTAERKRCDAERQALIERYGELERKHNRLEWDFKQLEAKLRGRPGGTLSS